MTDRSFTQYPEPPGTVFYESWCSDLEKGALKHGLDCVSSIDGAYVEIGCFEGRSTVFIANQIFPEELYAIDPWVPIPQSDYENAAYSKRDIERIFRNNVEVGTKGNVQINKKGWQQFFMEEGRTPASFPVKFIYLDGPHTYDDVYDSLGILTPFIVPGGVIVGDDYDGVEVRPAVDTFFGGDMTHPTSDRTWFWRRDDE